MNNFKNVWEEEKLIIQKINFLITMQIKNIFFCKEFISSI